MDVKYPNVKVKLTGTDGNAFALLGKVKTALKKAKVPEAEIKEFFAEATRDDYGHLLRTIMRTVDAR